MENNSQPTVQVESPLRKYYRQPKIQLKMPTNNLWYTEDILEMNENATVNILPMCGLDEIKAQTPEILAENKFKFDLIKSCVPAIKKPEKLAAVDINNILFAIQAATYGIMFKQSFVCQHCIEKSSKMDDKQRELAIENSQICIAEQTLEVSSNEIIKLSNYATTKEVFVDLPELKIYLKPVSIDIVDEMQTEQFYQGMLQNKIREYQESDMNSEEALKAIQDEVFNMSNKIYQSVMDMLIKCVDYIYLKEENIKVDDREEIKAFIENCPQKTIEAIRDARDTNFDNLGIPSSYKVACKCCQKLTDVPVSFFNPTNFFVQAS